MTYKLGKIKRKKGTLISVNNEGEMFETEKGVKTRVKWTKKISGKALTKDNNGYIKVNRERGSFIHVNGDGEVYEEPKLPKKQKRKTKKRGKWVNTPTGRKYFSNI